MKQSKELTALFQQTAFRFTRHDLAIGDVNDDDTADIVTAPGAGGGPQVRVISGRTGQELPGTLGSFLAFAPIIADLGAATGTAAIGNQVGVRLFTGGLYVAAGDINCDGYADIIIGAGAGGGPQVQFFSGKDGRILHNFWAYDRGYRGGVRVGYLDPKRGAAAQIITAPGGDSGPQVKVFDSVTLAELSSFFAFDPLFRSGLWVAGR